MLCPFVSSATFSPVRIGGMVFRTSYDPDLVWANFRIVQIDFPEIRLFNRTGEPQTNVLASQFGRQFEEGKVHHNKCCGRPCPWLEVFLADQMERIAMSHSPKGIRTNVKEVRIPGRIPKYLIGIGQQGETAGHIEQYPAMNALSVKKMLPV